MRSKYSRTFALKQHTPIIHFQHDQAGASLRATELKPKIDRFIREDLEHVQPALFQEYVSEIDKFFRTNEPLRSPYKVISSATPTQKVLLFSLTNKKDAELILRHSMSTDLFGADVDIAHETPMFANNNLIKIRGSWNRNDRRITDESVWEDLRIGVWLVNISITIRGYRDRVNELIGECLPYVLALENFGLRQSKGFGCFLMPNSPKLVFSDLLRSPEIEGIYKKRIDEDWKEALKVILNVWKLLKAGNSFGSYYKSDIMKYFCMMNNIRWEKRHIKKALYDEYKAIWSNLRYDSRISYNRVAGCHNATNAVEDVFISNEEERFEYIRALLGVAEHFEYGTQDTRDKVLINIKSKHVERFQSPVRFKIVDDHIYMICHHVPERLSTRGNGEATEFDFTVQAKIRSRDINGELVTLSVPSEFSLCDFLDSPWMGKNFEHSSKWGDQNAQTVAQHHGFSKIPNNE